MTESKPKENINNPSVNTIKVSDYIKTYPNISSISEIFSDQVMRGFFVTGTLLFVAEVSGYAPVGIFSNFHFNFWWNYADSVFSGPSIAANKEALNKTQTDVFIKRRLLELDTLAATFLFVGNTLTICATLHSDWFGSATDNMLLLGAYGFAGSMTASATRAIRDTINAYKKCDPIYLSESLSKKYLAIEDQNSPERKRLRNEALAIARVVYAKDPSQLKNLGFNDMELRAAPTEAEKLFVYALMERQAGKLRASLANATGYSLAAVCFWTSATGHFSMDSSASAQHIEEIPETVLLFTATFILGGVVKLFQLVTPLLAATPDWYKTYQMKETIFTTPEAQALKNNFPEIGENLSNDLKINYKMAFEVSLQKDPSLKDKEIQFYQSLSHDPNKDKLLSAAVEEYIILRSLKYDRQEFVSLMGLGGDIEKHRKSILEYIRDKGLFSQPDSKKEKGKLKDKTPSNSKLNP